MKIGYLRVSTEEQRPDRQIDALTPICDELHVEKLSA
ncbi:MAG: recombinase family protein, partial [Rhodobacteraceae bacterium]|nr:recombinase family protein [Paracoccaceae bacterium]